MKGNEQLVARFETREEAEKFIDEKLGTPGLIALSLVVFGALLLWADQRQGSRSLADYTTADAVKVGLAQVIALNPGTSRSGITMTAARLLTIDELADRSDPFGRQLAISPGRFNRLGTFRRSHGSLGSDSVRAAR